jgi:hypothetical protein
MQIGYLMWMSYMPRVNMSWRCCYFMEVMQTDNLNEVYHEGRTRNT